MAPKKKAEEELTPEGEDHGNLPKKRKTGHVLAIDPIYAASRSDFLSIIENLVGVYPNIKSTNLSRECDFSSLPKDIDVEMLIEVFESVGAAYGLECWKIAVLLREAYGIPKTTLSQSEWEKLALRNKQEFQTVAELKQLLGQRRTHWTVQAYFLGRRTLEKHNCFPSGCIIFNMYNFASHIWNHRPIAKNQPRCFAVTMFLIELFGKKDYLERFIRNPTWCSDIGHWTFCELFNTLGDPTWTELDLTKPDTVLTFDHLMDTLGFCFLYQVKVYDQAPEDEIKMNEEWTIQSRADKLEDISKLILVILKLLVSIPKSKTERRKLKSKLAIYINIYKLKRANLKPNLLLKVCTAHQGDPNEFKLIKLLLKAGADPNAVDEQRCSPLHLLADREVESSHMWGDASYSTRAEYFTSIVRVILDGRFYEDQVNLRGQSALECLKPFLSLYPNAQLCLLAGNFLQQLQGVRPLSCIAAKVVRKHQLPCECLPVTLQSMVLQH
ncbi:hypothetical protein DAPPUDRAFT_96505 [Daphnia pulex]|uniref:Uncharacterized protein n=1 Tax=Daphnia pulex TaxID=6669 RepID=E9FY12_DAPPU|nr:hypothetical protein DAPPUDRAFT_96505 [Daphnia pulex]|eukprot:EFX88192.1 hypothetical protein DAPPUDRAFT_96505 [Daphnia pulex]